MSSSYDLDAELRGMQRRLKRGIERNYLIGMARLHDMTPEAYAAKLDKERQAAAVAASRDAMEQIGAAYRRMSDTLVRAAESFARGWQAEGREGL